MRQWRRTFDGGHLKSTFVQNSQFLTPSFLSPCSTLFVLHVPLFSTYVHFSELPPPLSKKVRQQCCRTNVANVYEFSNEKMGSKKRDKNYFFCKLNMKYCFLHSFIYKDNKNIYKFIKNVKWKKKIVCTFFIKKTPLYAGLGSKQQLPSNLSMTIFFEWPHRCWWKSDSLTVWKTGVLSCVKLKCLCES